MNWIKRVSTSNFGRTLLALWALSIVAFLAIALIGVMKGEAESSLATAILIAAIVLIPVLVISCFSSQESQLLIRATWLIYLLVLLALVIKFILEKMHGSNSDLDIVLIYSLIALSFPLGYLAAAVAGIGSASIGPWSLAIVWCACGLIGYLQWFVMLRHLFGKKRSP